MPYSHPKSESKAIEKTGYKPGVDVYISLASASSEFYKKNKY